MAVDKLGGLDILVAIRSYGGLALCYQVRHLALGEIYAVEVCNTAGASAV